MRITSSLRKLSSIYEKGLLFLPDDLYDRLTPKQELTTINSVADLDWFFDRAATLFERSEDEARLFLNGIQLAAPPMPVDPFSDAYKNAQWKLYEQVSGKERYDVENEHSDFDLDIAIKRPFPYSTGSSGLIGDQLIAYGFIIKTLGIKPGDRIVEFGAGWGNLSQQFALLGCDVTVVEIDPSFVKLIEASCRSKSPIRVLQGDMLTCDPGNDFDIAIFFESFHHCSDHLDMLRRLHNVIRPGGRVAFASEPIGALQYPWGLRLDGLSLWSTRKYGWLELGFTRDYFFEALRKTGWTAQRARSRTISPMADIVIATKG